jgi:hypothetical protein
MARQNIRAWLGDSPNPASNERQNDWGDCQNNGEHAMKSLTTLLLELLQYYNLKEDQITSEIMHLQLEAEHLFIEQLTFSAFEDIHEMIDIVFYSNDYLAVPVWLRNLAFRLACLLEPSNAAIRRNAAADLRAFGPDWDDRADQIEREADEIDGMR